MAMKIVGRTNEVNELERIYQSKKAEFVTVVGRRRIGKTFLVKDFFSNKRTIFFTVTGEEDGSMVDQIDNFTTRLGEVFYHGVKPELQKTWRKTFYSLNSAIKNMVGKQQKVVIFLDELPWLATPKSKLLQTLTYFWNEYWSLDPRVKLIVSGSSASWITRKIINSKGGLHNRVTKQIKLQPYTELMDRLIHS